MRPTVWTISRRGNRWVIVFENSARATEVDLTEGQYRRLISESTERLDAASAAGPERKAP